MYGLTPYIVYCEGPYMSSAFKSDFSSDDYSLVIGANGNTYEIGLAIHVALAAFPGVVY